MAVKKKQHTGSLNEIKLRPDKNQKQTIKEIKRMMATNLASRAILGALDFFMQIKKEHKNLLEKHNELEQKYRYLLDSVEQFNLAQDNLAQASKELASTSNNHSWAQPAQGGG